MDKDEVRRRIIRRARRALQVPRDRKIHDESHFVNDLGADSLRGVTLVMDFEDACVVQIPDEDAQRIKTVGDAVQLIMWIQDGRKGEHPLGDQAVTEGTGALGTVEMSLKDFGM